MTYEKRENSFAFIQGMSAAEQGMTLRLICKAQGIDWIDGGSE